MPIFKMNHLLAASALSFFAATTINAQSVVTLQEGLNDYAGTDDTSIYELNKNFTNGGAGHIYVGLSGAGNNHRAMIRFDLTSIPTDAVVESAELRLVVERVGPGRPVSEPHRLNRMLKAWGEGTTNSDDPGGIGAQAVDGDSTWLANFFNQSTWDNPGGDFDAEVTATANAGLAPSTTVFASAQLTADVQNWIENPDQNFGWMVRSTETGVKASTRFYSSEGEVPGSRPMLVLELAATSTPTPSVTPTATPSPSPSISPSPTASASPSPTLTASPTLSPSITPTPTAVVTPTPLAEFGFTEDSEGWEFQTTDVFNAPTSEVSEGAIKIITSQPNSFGFWSSPVLSPVSQGKRSAMPGVILKKAVYTVSSDVEDPALSPTVRLRVNSANFEWGSVVVAESQGDGAFSPSTTSRDYEQYYILPASTTSFLLSFDALHFDANDAANSTLALESVVVTEEAREIGMTLLDDSFTSQTALGWTPWNAGPNFPMPDFGLSDLGLKLGGGIRAETRDASSPDVIGYWQQDQAFELTGGTAYAVEFRITTDADEFSRAEIPTLRFRVNSTDLKFATYVVAESVNGDVALPVTGELQTYVVYFVAPQEIDGQQAMLSLDYILDDSTNDDLRISVYLGSVRAYELDPVVP